jgi:hypothetical protein
MRQCNDDIDMIRSFRVTKLARELFSSLYKVMVFKVQRKSGINILLVRLLSCTS